MQNGETIYTQFYYKAHHQTCTAENILYCEAIEKVVDIHYLDSAGTHCTLMVNNISLAQMQRDHLGSFVQVNRNLIVRDKHMQLILPTATGKDHVMYVHHVSEQLPISRRRLSLVKTAFALEQHAKNQVLPSP